MSDFLFSQEKQQPGELSKRVAGIYHEDPPSIFEFHGEWGSLAISRNPYVGFDPYENDRHLFVIVGGPVLTFRDNDFLIKKSSCEATISVYEQWMRKNTIQWDSNLSGPYACCLIDKIEKTITVVTDMLSYIPVFISEKPSELVLGTHVDLVARMTLEETRFDPVSMASFILHSYIVYPYTVYQNVRMLSPSSVHKWSMATNEKVSVFMYWHPSETAIFSDIDKTAEALRKALTQYINRVTASMDEVGLFISGGEDSRVVLASLPKHLKKDAFIFLDAMNREGQIAKRATDNYDARFHFCKRGRFHYLDILEPVSDLIGSGGEYGNVHAYRFSHVLDFKKFQAFFGGYNADAFLKGYFINKWGQWKFPFLPEFKRKTPGFMNKLHHDYFSHTLLEQVSQRIQTHYQNVSNFMPSTADEWAFLWPISNDSATPNITGSRRLFANYEPFNDCEIIKLSASVPHSWKLNRKLFNKAFKRPLRKSKFLPHTNGRLPYFPWQVNTLLAFFHWSVDKTRQLTKTETTIQGSWTDFNALYQSSRAKKRWARYDKGVTIMDQMFSKAPLAQNLQDAYGSDFTASQQANLLQLAYFLTNDSVS